MTRSGLRKYNLPDAPGVYIFKKGRKILYIGKAASLQDRVRSYFATDLVNGRGARIVGMVTEATSVSWQKTDSVLEALILEANLIKRHQPPYNSAWKDNKSWNYVVITKEDFPRVHIVRGRVLFQKYRFGKSIGHIDLRNRCVRYVFGPFPYGGQLHETLRLVRRIFPYRDKCVPKSGKPCFNRQIGLCPGVCTGEISRAKYTRTIRNIKDLFLAKFKGLKGRLAQEMKAAAHVEDFERAESLRRQVSALEHIRDVSLIKAERRVAPRGLVRAGGTRIEALDVAHTSGTETAAVATVVEDGHPAKAFYRKFKIRNARNDDVSALKEALSRRLNHPEWPLPRLFVVDGGKAQVRAAERILKDAGLMIPVVGVVKNEFHKPERLLGDQRIISANERDILLANSEAHRFAIGWHRKRRRRGMI